MTTNQLPPEDQQPDSGADSFLGPNPTTGEAGSRAASVDPGVSKWVKRIGIGAAALVLALGVAACTNDGGQGAETSGHESGEASEGSSEGTDSGESSEGGSGLGEAAEAGHGGDGGNGEAAEGGAVNLLTPDETYDETINGARLILAFDTNANAFVGTVENTTDEPLTRARVEVHLSNGTELGPTTPTDLAPGEILPIVLKSTTAAFDTWSAHPEVGSAEGREGSSGEGAEDTEGGTAATTYLSSSGVSRGVFTTQALQADEANAGNMNGLEFALTYDPSTGSFSGRVKNEAGEGICDVSFRLILDGDRTNSQSLLIPSLDDRERADFSIRADTVAFTTWTVETNTYTCNAVPVHGGGGEGAESGSGESGTEDGSEGAEGAGHEGGSEGAEGAGHEGGSEGAEGGGEGGGEADGKVTPIDQPTITTINGLDVNFIYDTATKAFRGTVANNTNEAMCVRMEIHIDRNGQTIELGPTVDRNLAPGESQEMVLAFDAVAGDWYGLHPEAAPCP